MKIIIVAKWKYKVKIIEALEYRLVFCRIKSEMIHHDVKIDRDVLISKCLNGQK